MPKPVATKSSVENKGKSDSDVHKDLEHYCFVWTFEMLSEEEFESTEEVLNAAQNTESMLKADTAKERIKAARALLKQHPECGLPYLIFARDGETTEREENYRRAIELLTIEAEKAQGYEEAVETSQEELEENEHFQSLLDWYEETPYAFEIEGVGYVVAEFARILWQEGRHEEAVNLFPPALQLLQGRGALLQSVLASYLIQSKKDDLASSLLDQMPLPYPEWYYSKALLLFRKHGDNEISRSALKLALNVNAAIANLFLTGEIVDDTESLENELKFGPSRIDLPDAPLLLDASSGWRTTSGAIEWLTKTSTRVIPLATMRQIANPQFISRYKLWKTNFEIADLQIERGNMKEAKKNARMAFKEVRKAGAISNALFESIEQLTSIAEEYDDAFGEITQSLEELVAECRRLENKDESVAITVKLAECYQRLDKHEIAINLLDEVAADVQALCEKNDPASCLDQLADALCSKGRSLSELERWQEAKPVLERSLELHQTYLSNEHPDLLLTMKLLSACLVKTGDTEKANELDERIKAIEIAFFGEFVDDTNI